VLDCFEADTTVFFVMGCPTDFHGGQRKVGVAIALTELLVKVIAEVAILQTKFT